MRALPGTLGALVRCDGGHAIGLGHVKRSLALADALLRNHALRTVIAGRFEPAAAEAILRADVAIAAWPEGEPEAPWLKRVVERERPRVLVCDTRSPLSRDDLLELRPRLSGIVTIDDPGPRRLAADIAVLPPTPAARALTWPEGIEALIGWEYVTLALRPPPRAPGTLRVSAPFRVLVAMGGADPAGLTVRVAEALRPLAGKLAPLFVIGPAFQDGDGLAATIAAWWPAAEIARAPGDLVSLYAKADCAVVAYGVTAQELAAAGVPALYIGLGDDHVASAAALAETGVGVCLGRHDAIGDDVIREALAALLDTPGRLAAMAEAGPRTIDGQGAERLAARISLLMGQGA